MQSNINPSIVVIQCLDAQQQTEKHQIAYEIERLTNELEDVPTGNSRLKKLITDTIRTLEVRLETNRTAH